MSTVNNDEALQGMRVTEQVAKPLLMTLKYLYEKWQAGVSDFSDFVQYVREHPERAKEELLEKLNKELGEIGRNRSLMLAFNQEELSDTVGKYSDFIKADFENTFLSLHNLSEQKAKELFENLSALEKMNVVMRECFDTKDFATAKEKIDQIFAESPIGKKLGFDKSMESELQNRFKEAVKEAQAYNASKQTRELTKSVERNMEKAL